MQQQGRTTFIDITSSSSSFSSSSVMAEIGVDVFTVSLRSAVEMLSMCYGE
ncbi:hypothetical protein EXN66_Car015378 [Channa argus]|uniref:Uncharacterized protein n=1 Tax=Channa argus TaxID=215402 RepID=A0A6G1QAM9_CHAAH|nr:hypothetical protein EXN66_Car015378 [Channa argus]